MHPQERNETHHFVSRALFELTADRQESEYYSQPEQSRISTWQKASIRALHGAGQIIKSGSGFSYFAHCYFHFTGGLFSVLLIATHPASTRVTF
jgi:hypothetical protein